MFTENIILAADSYKASHWLQLPPKTTFISAYGEARASIAPEFDEVTNFGLGSYRKMYLEKYLTKEHIEEAESFIVPHGLPFNKKGWELIVNEYGGHLPIVLKTLPEGMTVPVGTPLYQVESNDKSLPWVASYVETSVLRASWYGTTVATYSRNMRRLLVKYAKITGMSLDQVDFKMHDFGPRGASSSETAALGGLAHLTAFKGTDNLEALYLARKHFGVEMAGYSIPAMEHSTVTIWGRLNELAAYANMVDRYAKPGAVFAVVIDSYDSVEAVKMIYEKLGEKIRTSGATIVLRPDSGDPLTEPLGIIELAMSLFGFSENGKGFKVLPDHVRVIQGDGISYNSVVKILENMVKRNISLDNLAFGQGGKLLQSHSRDDFAFAMKTSYGVVDGEGVDVFKDPITDSGKRSKAGRLDVLRSDGGIITTVVKPLALPSKESLLRPIWQVGEITSDTAVDSFQTIRDRVLA